MKKLILTLSVLTTLISCNNSSVTNEVKHTKETIENTKELVVSKPLVNIGYFSYDRTYNTLIGKAFDEHTRIEFTTKDISIKTYSDYWRYNVISVTISNNEVFEAICIDEIGDEYTITIREQILRTERMSNNSFWFDVTHKVRDSFEKSIKW